MIPRNPLDVLAQHLVSMVADDEWEVDEVERLVTATEPFKELSREQLENVLDMLDGRYPSEKFAELRPRLVWDRTAGHGARPQGRAPARGHQRRHDPRPRPLRRPPPRRPPGRRARRGDGLRGAARADLPARRDHLADPGDHPRPGDRRPRRPGVPGAVPFWRGDGVGRPSELGRAIGAFAREAVGKDAETLAAEYDLDRARGREPGRLPARAAGGDPGRALRRDDRGREVPRRDRRLAPVRALAVRRPRPRRLGAGAVGPDPRRARPRGRRDLVRRRDRRPPPRRRRAARRPTSSCSSPTRSRTWSSASSAARRCSAPASARTPPAAC